MKVIKINKREFIAALILVVVNISIHTIGFSLATTHPELGFFMVGFATGTIVPLFFGVTKVDREREPFEVIEIEEKEK